MCYSLWQLLNRLESNIVASQCTYPTLRVVELEHFHHSPSLTLVTIDLLHCCCLPCGLFLALLCCQGKVLAAVQQLPGLSHPNIMRLCGYSFHPPALVTEYQRHGTVSNLLLRAQQQHRGPGSSLRKQNKVSTAATAECGLLHIQGGILLTTLYAAGAAVLSFLALSACDCSQVCWLDTSLVIYKSIKHCPSLLSCCLYWLVTLGVVYSTCIPTYSRRFYLFVIQLVQYLNWKRRLGMLQDTASGLLYLHSRGYLLGQLSSANMFVGADGKVRCDTFTVWISPQGCAACCRRVDHLTMSCTELLSNMIWS